MNGARLPFFWALGLVLLIASCVTQSAVVQDRTISLSEEEYDGCIAEGGCVLISRAKLVERIEKAAAKMPVAYCPGRI